MNLRISKGLDFLSVLQNLSAEDLVLGAIFLSVPSCPELNSERNSCAPSCATNRTAPNNIDLASRLFSNVFAFALRSAFLTN